MKILSFSDLHIDEYPKHNIGYSRLLNTTSVIPYLFDAAESHGIQTITFSGDLFNTKHVLKTVVINEAIKAFKAAFTKHPNIHFYAISGNHDHTEQNTYDDPSPNTLQSFDAMFDNFHLIDNDIVITKDGILCGIPYYANPQDYHKALDNIIYRLPPNAENAANTILLTHQTPNGVTFIEGDTNPLDARYRYFVKVLNGHIHVSTIFSDTYINMGAAIHKDESDLDQQRGFWLIEGVKHTFCSLNKAFPIFTHHPKKATDYFVPVPKKTTEKVIQSAKYDATQHTPQSIVETYFAQTIETEPFTQNEYAEILAVGHSFLTH